MHPYEARAPPCPWPTSRRFATRQPPTFRVASRSSRSLATSAPAKASLVLLAALWASSRAWSVAMRSACDRRSCGQTRACGAKGGTVGCVGAGTRVRGQEGYVACVGTGGPGGNEGWSGWRRCGRPAALQMAIRSACDRRSWRFTARSGWEPSYWYYTGNQREAGSGPDERRSAPALGQAVLAWDEGGRVRGEVRFVVNRFLEEKWFPGLKRGSTVLGTTRRMGRNRGRGDFGRVWWGGGCWSARIGGEPGWNAVDWTHSVHIEACVGQRRKLLGWLTRLLAVPHCVRVVSSSTSTHTCNVPRAVAPRTRSASARCFFSLLRSCRTAASSSLSCNASLVCVFFSCETRGMSRGT